MSIPIHRLKEHLSTKLHWFFWGILFPLVFLAVLHLPDFIAVNSHDSGSQAIVEYWTSHGYQYGKDIIQNVGPLGFLTYPAIYTGILDLEKLAINIALTLFLTFLILDYSRTLKNPAAALLLIAGILFCVSSPEANFYLLSLLAAIKLLSTRRQLERVLAIAALTVLALSKGTFLFVSFSAISISIILELRRGRPRIAATVLAVYLLCMASLWTLCGQALANFPDYVQAMAAFSSGYNDAMAVYEARRMTNVGLLTLVLCSTLIAWKVVAAGRKPSLAVNLCMAGLVEAFILFLTWKHGFVRADEHMIIFFQFCLMACVVLAFSDYGNFTGQSPSPVSQAVAGPEIFRVFRYLNARLILCACIAVLAVYGLCQTIKVPPKQVLTLAVHRAKHKALYLLNLKTALNRLKTDMSDSKASMALPAINALAGSGGVGYFGVNPAPMIYNNFRYLSAPSNISFASWNEWIMKKNRDYYQDDTRAPENLLIVLGTIDNRIPAQDDSLAQLEIFNKYTPTLYEQEYMLMRRSPSKSDVTLKKLGDPVQYKLGEWITVPAGAEPVWAKIQLKESLLSKIVSIFYKPSEYHMESELLDGQPTHKRYMPRMGEVGFLLNPQINNNNDLVSAYYSEEYQKFRLHQPTNIKGTRRLMISCTRKILCSRELNIQFFSVDGLKFGSLSSGEYLNLISQQAGFEVKLIDVGLSQPIQPINAYGKQFKLFHAPSKLVMAKEKGKFHLRGSYGLAETAYEGAGKTDGVVVTVKFSPVTGGTSRTLWERTLDPLASAGDQGILELNVALPEEPGKITLEVSPRATNYFDHFFLDHLNIQ